MTTTIAGVVLAAGGGTRFAASLAAEPASAEPASAGPEARAQHKLRAQFRGRPVLSWVIDTVLSVGFNQVYVVTGAVALSDLLPPDVVELPNPMWATGQASSLQVAVAAAGLDGHDAIVVGLGDQPLIPAAAWRSVGAAAGQVVVASFDGQRQPPVKLVRPMWAQLPVEGDFGARALLQQRPELVSEIPCRGNPADIDTLEDLRQWS